MRQMLRNAIRNKVESFRANQKWYKLFFKKNIDIYISWGSVLFAKKLFQILKFIWTQLLAVNKTKSFLSLKTTYQNVAINMLLGEYLQKACLKY